MKNSISFIASVLFLMFILSACSHRLVGVWNVSTYQTIQSGETSALLTDIGTIEFHKKGTGDKKINYNLLGLTVDDNMPFNWTANNNIVTIDGQNSEFIKSWIVVEDKPKYQKWTSTDGGSTVQILELKK
jgi:hypothetical protein